MKKLVLFLTVVCTLGFATVASADNFSDPQGDSGSAPDMITINVGVTTDSRFVFDIHDANRFLPAVDPNQSFLLGDDGYAIYLDMDRDPGTGDPDNRGTEYRLVLLSGSPPTVTLSSWAKADGWVNTGASPVFGFVQGLPVPLVVVNAIDIGEPRAFNLWLLSGNETGRDADFAPDNGTYSFRFTPRCSDGEDNDSPPDNSIDREDPGCMDGYDNDETNPDVIPVCADGIDNDNDGALDYPDDPGCEARGNGSENENPGCTIEGDIEDNTIDGTEFDDGICSFPGNDIIRALEGNDLVLAGDGRDRVNAGRGNDIVKGGDGKDRLAGKNGKDRLVGGDGRDRIRAGKGKDRLVGKKGNDRFWAIADGKRDVIKCGRGHRDRVLAWEPFVDVLRKCEILG